jgi:hypothetical protein
MKLQPSICLTTALLVLTVTGSNISAGAEGKKPAAIPTGTWKWIAPTNPDGRTPEITFTLKLQGETLTGMVNKSTGTTTITNGMFKGDEVSFQTVFEGKRGKRTTTYSGKLSGDTIKGKMEADGGGPKISTDWEARRVKE